MTLSDSARLRGARDTIATRAAEAHTHPCFHWKPRKPEGAWNDVTHRARCQSAQVRTRRNGGRVKDAGAPVAQLQWNQAFTIYAKSETITGTAHLLMRGVSCAILRCALPMAGRSRLVTLDFLGEPAKLNWRRNGNSYEKLSRSDRGAGSLAAALGAHGFRAFSKLITPLRLEPSSWNPATTT